MFRRKISSAIISIALVMSSITAFADNILPDHRGTSMDGIEIGIESVNSNVKNYFSLFEKYGNQYGVDPNLLASVCQQESSGRNLSYRDDGSEYPAWGIMQIEYTMEKSFAKFGLETTGTEWTLEDRLDPEKSIAYAAYLLSEMLAKYDCDYLKTLQGYNFGEYVLDKIIDAKGVDWLSERENAKDYVSNWPYKSYGDAKYIEHVMKYYKRYMDYVGAKVRINDELVVFDNQYPIIENDRTMIPIRGVLEKLGAKVEWDHQNYTAVIEKDNINVKLPIGSDTAYVDGQEVKTDACAELKNGRTMVPLRFILETFNIQIEWDGETRTVNIYN